MQRHSLTAQCSRETVFPASPGFSLRRGLGGSRRAPSREGRGHACVSQSSLPRATPGRVSADVGGAHATTRARLPCPLRGGWAGSKATCRPTQLPATGQHWSPEDRQLPALQIRGHSHASVHILPDKTPTTDLILIKKISPLHGPSPSLTGHSCEAAPCKPKGPGRWCDLRL